MTQVFKSISEVVHELIERLTAWERCNQLGWHTNVGRSGNTGGCPHTNFDLNAHCFAYV